MAEHTEEYIASEIEGYAFAFPGSNAERYIRERGISQETAEKYQLGRNVIRPDKGGPFDLAEVLVIPTSPTTYISRFLDPNCDSSSRYRNSAGEQHFFNEAALTEAKGPIFITEGAIDALSIIECGGEAVSLNSTANVNRLLKLLESNRPVQKLIIAMDSDDAGKRAEKELTAGLSKLDSPYSIVSDWNDCKDANELLVRDRPAFEKLISKAVTAPIVLSEQDQAIFDMLQQNRMDNCITAMLSTISEKSTQPKVSMGFPALDDIFDGGITAGLYIVAAMSSLGKTTLVVQMAANMAQQGQDILFFTLEMSRLELFAKNISRHTFELDTKRHAQFGQSTTDILSGIAERDGKNALKAHIQKAVEAYRSYSDRITVIEGSGDISAANVRTITEDYIRLTGRTPVVVIDYIQLLQPTDIRMTDKQNMDASVMELKRLTVQGCPVIVISSLNRASYDSPVSMSSLKESGNLEYCAETILALDFEAMYDSLRKNAKDFDLNAEKQKPVREVLLTVLKNRNGRVGDQLPMLFYPKYNYFGQR